MSRTILQYNLLAFIASFLRVTDEDSLSQIAQYDPGSVFGFALKGTNFYLFIRSLTNEYGQLQMFCMCITSVTLG